MISPKVFLLAVLLAVIAMAQAAPRFFILDDGEVAGPAPIRVRRDTLAAPTGLHATGYKHGIVGPVYSFVKTDPKANFKWGVRHRIIAPHY